MITYEQLKRITVEYFDWALDDAAEDNYEQDFFELSPDEQTDCIDCVIERLDLGSPSALIDMLTGGDVMLAVSKDAYAVGPAPSAISSVLGTTDFDIVTENNTVKFVGNNNECELRYLAKDGSDLFDKFTKGSYRASDVETEFFDIIKTDLDKYTDKYTELL